MNLGTIAALPKFVCRRQVEDRRLCMCSSTAQTVKHDSIMCVNLLCRFETLSLIDSDVKFDPNQTSTADAESHKLCLL